MLLLFRTQTGVSKIVHLFLVQVLYCIKVWDWSVGLVILLSSLEPILAVEEVIPVWFFPLELRVLPPCG